MTNTHRVDVSKGSEALISIDLNKKIWHRLFHFVVMFQNSVNGLWHVVHHDVQVDFIFLEEK